MRITGSRLVPYRLPLRRPWHTASGSFTERRGWLVALETDDLRAGWGDCAPWPEAGFEQQNKDEAALRYPLSRMRDVHVDTGLRQLESEQTLTPAARCGLETALLDLLAQEAGVPLARWLNPRAAISVEVNAAVGAAGDNLAIHARTARAEGYRVLKIKVGIGLWRDELARLRELARELPGAVQLRLDANRAWDEAEARAVCDSLADLPVESLEEPLRHSDLGVLASMQQAVPFALALDESLRAWPFEEVLSRSPVRRLVLKPMLQGGLIRTWAMAGQARSAGMECVVTTTVDSAVGVLAATHLAAALNNGLAHGLATSSWLASDVATAPAIESGWLRLDGIGLGIGNIREER
jgi:o-succinylbenzoate synthase